MKSMEAIHVVRRKVRVLAGLGPADCVFLT